MTASSLLGWALAAAFLLFLARAVSMFVQAQKMPQTAERSNLRQRARTSANLAIFCILLSLGLRVFQQAAHLIPQTPPEEIRPAPVHAEGE